MKIIRKDFYKKVCVFQKKVVSLHKDKWFYNSNVFFKIVVISNFLNTWVNNFKLKLMVIVRDLTVKVTYTVGLGKVEIPQKVHKQLLEAHENWDKIEMCGISKYQDAYDWLSANIRESDCMDWGVEVEEVSEK